MNYKEAIKRIQQQGFTAYEIKKQTNLNETGVRRILNNEINNPQRKTKESLVKFAEENTKKIEYNTNKSTAIEKESIANKILHDKISTVEKKSKSPLIKFDKENIEPIQSNTNKSIVNEKKNNLNKVPYFETDVTSRITANFNDINQPPAFYVDYKPFNDCTAYVNNYGDSMFPKYKNGESLVLKQIFNLHIINWGETYLIVTNENANNLRTVKDVHPHYDVSKIILRASNPKYAGDTVIEKKDILSIFAIKGKISQNFI
jgi:phage repressor protein C with HTH and peptisase S24 domain